MTQLSPAAQEVLDAVCAMTEPDCDTQHLIAAALRAAAYTVLPLSYEDVYTDGKMLQYEKHDPIRERLLAIATELENQ